MVRVFFMNNNKRNKMSVKYLNIRIEFDVNLEMIHNKGIGKYYAGSFIV